MITIEEIDKVIKELYQDKFDIETIKDVLFDEYKEVILENFFDMDEEYKEVIALGIPTETADLIKNVFGVYVDNYFENNLY